MAGRHRTPAKSALGKAIDKAYPGDGGLKRFKNDLEDLGLSKTARAINDWRMGKYPPREDDWDVIAEALNTTKNEFVTLMEDVADRSLGISRRRSRIGHPTLEVRPASPSHAIETLALGSSGIVEIANEWWMICESPFVQGKLAEMRHDDKWYGICISAAAFTPLRNRIGRAIEIGIEIHIATLDLEKMDGDVACQYIRSMRPNDFDHSVQESEIAISTLKWTEKESMRPGRSKPIKFYKSRFPHPGIGFLCEPGKESRGWGFVSPYLLYPRDAHDFNFGLSFLDVGTNGIYERYLRSTKRYFSTLTPE